MRLLMFLLTFALAEVTYAKQTAFEVAKMVSESNDGFVGETGTMEMILMSAGSKISRKMSSQSMELKNEDRTLLEFSLPKDVAGTKLLTWSYEEEDDKQWIYLPALRRVKRITSSGKSSSFMGSEFTFEDLRTPALDKYKYSDLKTSDGSKGYDWSYIRTPKEKSGYSKQEVKIAKKYLSPTEIKFFDRSGELLKVATYEGFKEFKVGPRSFWRPSKITMENVQTQKKSIILWDERKIGVKQKASIFTKGALK